MFKNIFAAAIISTALSAPGFAATVSLGFEDFSYFSISSETVIEDGFTLQAIDMYGDSGGTDGDREMERRFLTDGTLTVTRPGALFTFDSIDWQYEGSTSPGASISLAGFFNGTLLATDTFTSTSSSYATFSASLLAGLGLDTLIISADRDGFAVGSFDALVVSDAAVSAVPLPAAGWMLLAGIGGLGALRKRRG